TSRYHSADLTWSRTAMVKCSTPLVLMVLSPTVRSFRITSPSLSAIASLPLLLLIAARDFGLPRRHPTLDPADQRVQTDGQQHQYDNRHEHGRRVKVVGRVDDDSA